LRAWPLTERLHARLKAIGVGVPLIKIKIYNLQGIAVYSSVPAEIGEDKSQNVRLHRCPRWVRPLTRVPLRARSRMRCAAAKKRPSPPALYVEDNPANILLMEVIAARVTNTRLLTAHNAELGIELAAMEHPNLIIMDRLFTADIPGLPEIAWKLVGVARRRRILRGRDTIAAVRRLLHGSAFLHDKMTLYRGAGLPRPITPQ